MGGGHHRDAPRTPAPADERRGGVRHLVCVPAHVHVTDSPPAGALIRDISLRGALLLTRKKLDVGEEVTLELYLSENAAEAHATRATVVRATRRDPATAGIWPHSAAVRFAAPLTEIEPKIRALAARQAELGLTRR